MSGWTPDQDVERAAIAHLTTVIGPISARQLVDGLLAKGRAMAAAEAQQRPADPGDRLPYLGRADADERAARVQASADKLRNLLGGTPR